MNENPPDRVFVSGATGVVGRRVIPPLVAAGNEVTAVGRTPEKRRWLQEHGARAVAVDLFDVAAVRSVLDKMDVVLNLATAVPAAGPGMFFPWGWRAMDRVRRRVSANLVDAALAGGTVRRFVQESFAPIYADGGDAWLDESAPIRAARYNRSVLDAEAAAGRFTEAGRIGVVLRFGLFYGPDDPMTRQFLTSVRNGRYPLFGRPDAFWTWISHDDAASAVVAALDAPAGVYNAVEDDPLRRRDQAEGLGRLLGVPTPRVLPRSTRWLGGVLGGTLCRSLRISNRKLKEDTAWTPRHRSIVEGIEAILSGAPEEEGR
jgi:nucleoside-diphosphate-sugar epimerase